MANTNMGHPIAIGRKQKFVSFEDYKLYQQKLMNHRENADQVMAHARNSDAQARREPANRKVAALTTVQAKAAAVEAGLVAAYAKRSHATPPREPEPDVVHIAAVEVSPREFQVETILWFGRTTKRVYYPNTFSIEGVIVLLENLRAGMSTAKLCLSMSKGADCA